MTRAASTRDHVAMKGGGYYSENTAGAKDVIDNTAELALAALDRMDIAAEGPAFAVADFGAADGGTSIDMMRALVGRVRERSPARAVTVTYTDLPHNDFSALFQLLDGQRPGVPSYLAEYENVFAYGSGTGFYERIFPAGTLDFGFSATAMHWLKALPGRIPNHVHMVGATGDALAVFAAAAAVDWERLLTHRAVELRPGAALVMSNFCIDEAGRHLGNTGGVNMFDTFNRLWRGMADDGAITPAEVDATAFPQYYRNVEEYAAPLRDEACPVHQLGLRLESIETRVVKCPYAAAFAAGKVDAAAFAASYVPTLRSWSEVVFASGLSAKRSAQERAALIDEFYGRYESAVRAAPEGHAMDYVHAYMVTRKTNSQDG